MTVIGILASPKQSYVSEWPVFNIIAAHIMTASKIIVNRTSKTGRKSMRNSMQFKEI